MSHYHTQGKNEEGRMINSNGLLTYFQQFYSDFDVEIYRNFNSEISHLNNEELMIHYHNSGFIENNNYFNFEFDFEVDDQVNPNTNLDLYLKFKDHTYFRTVETYEQLVDYHKTYKKNYYIYNKQSFYKYYDDFDYDFYKNKYFQDNETIDEIGILLYYHLYGISQNHLINNKIKIIMYSPPYDNKSGGIIVMHYLCYLINQMDKSKYYAKLFMHNDVKYNNRFCTDFAKINEINDNTIVIYPEIVRRNPLNAKNVVRWILLELGIEMPLEHCNLFGKNDYIYHWESNNLPHYNQLSCPWLNPVFYNKNIPKENKQKTCYLIKKGRLIHKQIHVIHPQDSICIDDLSLEEINNVFNECKYFYCYDPNSAFIIFAVLCGCIPILQPIEGVNENDFFKSRIFNFKGTIYNKGIIYGYDENKIQALLQEGPNEFIDYYKSLFDMYIETVKHFLMDTEKIIYS
jgi:hypothetical protein